MKFNNTIKKNKIRVEIDLSKEIKGVKNKKEFKQKVGEAFLNNLADELSKERHATSASSHKGVPYEKLSKDYREFKKAKGKGTKADLHLDSNMFNALTIDTETKDKVIIKVTDSLQKKKMFNHCTGDTLPKRQALPTRKNGKFNQNVMSKVNKTIKELKK